MHLQKRGLIESEYLRKKGVSPKYIAKLVDSEKRWRERALQIEKGKVQNTWDMLEERGFVKNIAG